MNFSIRIMHYLVHRSKHMPQVSIYSLLLVLGFNKCSNLNCRNWKLLMQQPTFLNGSGFCYECVTQNFRSSTSHSRAVRDSNTVSIDIFLYCLSPLSQKVLFGSRFKSLLSALLVVCCNKTTTEECDRAKHPKTEQALVQIKDEELVPKKGGFVVWMWFGYNKSNTNQKTVICKVCHKIGQEYVRLFCIDNFSPINLREHNTLWCHFKILMYSNDCLYSTNLIL